MCENIIIWSAKIEINYGIYLMIKTFLYISIGGDNFSKILPRIMEDWSSWHLNIKASSWTHFADWNGNLTISDSQVRWRSIFPVLREHLIYPPKRRITFSLHGFSNHLQIKSFGVEKRRLQSQLHHSLHKKREEPLNFRAFFVLNSAKPPKTRFREFGFGALFGVSTCPWMRALVLGMVATSKECPHMVAATYATMCTETFSRSLQSMFLRFVRLVEVHMALSGELLY